MARGEINIQTPAARATDPETSHQAAEHMNETGKRRSQQYATLALVKEFPSSTSFELSRRGSLDRYQVARRMSELRTAELVEEIGSRVCKISRRHATIWRATGGEHE